MYLCSKHVTRHEGSGRRAAVRRQAADKSPPSPLDSGSLSAADVQSSHSQSSLSSSSSWSSFSAGSDHWVTLSTTTWSPILRLLLYSSLWINHVSTCLTKSYQWRRWLCWKIQLKWLKFDGTETLRCAVMIRLWRSIMLCDIDSSIWIDERAPEFFFPPCHPRQGGRRSTPLSTTFHLPCTD